MNGLVREYKEHLLMEELAEGTVDTYIREAGRFMELMGEEPVTKRAVMDYKDIKNRSGLKAATVNLHLVAVNKFLKYMGRGDCCVKLNRIQKIRSVDNVISKKEYEALCGYAMDSDRKKYYYLMRTLAGTGIRVGELRYFTVESIKSGVICVRNKGKNREIFVSSRIRRELEEYSRDEDICSGVIFRGNTAQVISRNSVFKMLKSMAGKVGISQQKVHPHSFRHLFALTYMEKYHNLSELADILGHSSLETTRIYLSDSAEKRRAKLGALGL